MTEELPIVDGFVALDHMLEKAIDAITKRFPNWDYRVDERLLVLVKLRNFTCCGKLAILFKDTCLKDADWWRSVESVVSEFDRHPKRDQEFDVFARFAMFQGLFSIYEAALRSLTAVLTGSPPPDKLHQVRVDLLQSLSSLLEQDKDTYSDLMRFVGTIRNCVHNNMAHTGKDVTLKYRDAEFEFHRGQPPGFLDWHLFIHLAYDLAKMFQVLVQTSEISELPAVPSFVDFNLRGPTKPA